MSTALKTWIYQHHAIDFPAHCVSINSIYHFLQNDYSEKLPLIYANIADYFNLDFLDQIELDQNILTINQFPLDWLVKQWMIPISYQNQMVSLAICDPTVCDFSYSWMSLRGFNCQFYLASFEKIERVCMQIKSKLLLIDESLNRDKKAEKIIKSKQEIQSTPLLNFMNDLLEQAVHRNASDIHIEPQSEKVRIRLRIDGRLTEVTSINKNYAEDLAIRLKVQSQCDITEKRLPQDGQFQVELQNKTINIRFSTCSTIYGEKLVLRILSDSQKLFSIDELELNSSQKNYLTRALDLPSGLIFVTGPTGSGKTNTLYSGLQYLNTPKKNIITIEDPVEIYIPGINQVNVQTKLGFDFAKALKTFLRQDPDIIMLGEIRDAETAEIAFKAAQTGHLVLATLHTGSSYETLLRLNYLGIDNFLIANTVSLIIAQRLVRKCCQLCLSAIKRTSQKCHCIDGYDGRIALFEMLPINHKIKELISNKAAQDDIYHEMQNMNCPDLVTSGKTLIEKHLTTQTELNSVLGIPYGF